MDNTMKTARQVCEAYLEEQIRYNEAHEILPSESSVARRMLARGDDLVRFYDEIYPALNRDGIAWKHAITCALYTGAFWSPEKLSARRDSRKELEKINREIAINGKALADLLARRQDLHEKSGFGSQTLSSITDVIDAASAHNGHYEGFLKEPLSTLSLRYDGKYWPSLGECVQAIPCDADNAEIVANDEVTHVATRSTRPSKADSVRALLATIENYRGDGIGAIPFGFEFSDAALADLLNIIFEIPADEPVSAEYVKNERHKYRRAS